MRLRLGAFIDFASSLTIFHRTLPTANDSFKAKIGIGIRADRLSTNLEPKKSWFDKLVPQIMHFCISADGGVPGIALGMVVFRFRIGGRRFMIALFVAAIISILHTALLAWAYSQLFVIDTSIIS